MAIGIEQLEQEVRGRMRREPAYLAAFQGAFALLEAGIEPVQALRQARQWISRFGRPPRDHEWTGQQKQALGMFLSAVAEPGQEPVGPWMLALLWYASIAHFGAPPDICSALPTGYIPFWMALQRHGAAISPELRAETFEVLAALVRARGGSSAESLAAAVSCEALAGCALTKAASGTERYRGKGMLERAVIDLEHHATRRAADPKAYQVVAHVHSQALHNLAHAFLDQPDATADDLRKSLDLFRKVLALPARQADPMAMGMTWRAIGTTVRRLAGLSQEQPVIQQLRSEAQDAYSQARRAFSKDPRGRNALVELEHGERNLRLEILADGVESGAATQRDLQAEAERSLRWLEASGLDMTPALQTCVFRWQAWAGLERELERTVKGLQALTKSHRPLSFEEAARLPYLLKAMASAVNLTVHAPTIDGVIDRIQPWHVGLGLARVAWLAEWALMAQALESKQGESEISEILCTWLERALSRYQALLADARGTLLDRQVLSAARARVAALYLTKHVQLALSPARFLALCDALSGSAYAAEALVYGVGPVTRASVEGNWRLNFLRTRCEADRFAFLVEAPDLLHKPQPWAPNLEPDFLVQVNAEIERIATSRATMTDDGRVIMDEKPADMREVLRKERTELAGRVAVGQQRGWMRGIDSVGLGEQAVTDWLVAHPGIAVLHLGWLQPTLTVADAAGRVHCIPLAQVPDEHAEPLERQMVFVDATDPQQSSIELSLWADQMRPLGKAISRAVADHSLTGIAIRAVGWALDQPWAALQVDDNGTSLADLVPVAGLPTLAEPPRQAERATSVPARNVWVFGCEPGQEPAVDAGRGAPEVGDSVASAPTRLAFESLLLQGDVLRVFTHGQHNPVYARVSALQLRSPGNARENSYSVEELLCADARRCQRVELWACEAGAQLDFVLQRVGASEPMGWSAAFRLAGARVVISALWPQFSWTAAALAYYMRRHCPGDAGALRTAKILAEAIAWYRRALEQGGDLETAALEAVSIARDRPVLQVTFEAAWKALTGNTFHASTDQLMSTALGSQMREGADSAACEAAPEETVRRLLDWLRSPMAWAGWRVDARSGSCL